jgi:murein DD-endopeptidase MepM/ murein hydrolase activator NlpD
MILNYPCTNHKISLEFGYDASTDLQYSGFYTLFDNKHPGVDFDLPVGTDIFASFEGIVVRIENHKGMGNTIGIRNGNILGLYAHLSEIKVDLGQVVKAGDLIAMSGNTGAATTSPHLHFELRDMRFKDLNEMVFKPVFEKEIENFHLEFIYKVNNQNIGKNLKLISERFFGSSLYISVLAERNNLKLNSVDLLPQDLNLIIPNY